MKLTIWQFLKEEGWIIKMRDLKEMDINPKKDYDDITLREIGRIADFLDVRIGDIIDF